MKKLLTIGIVFALVLMLSAGVMAWEHLYSSDTELVPPDFANWYENYWNANELGAATQVLDLKGDDTYTTIKGVLTWRDDIVTDVDDQHINLKLDTIAMIPCYLEMELVGNAGYTKAKSIGAGAIVDYHKTGSHRMGFRPELGGFIDADWNFLGIDAEVIATSLDNEDFSTLGPGVYIAACDMWTANLYGNVPYDFRVDATALSQGDRDLFMDMRYLTGSIINIEGFNDFGDDAIEVVGLGSGENGEYDFGEFEICTVNTVLMQFRVPFEECAPAGLYHGTITFRMSTV